MKTKAWILIGILIVAFAAMVAPVMAATSGTATIQGNPPYKMDLTVSGTISNWDLDPSATQPITDSSTVTMTVKSNDRSWVVSAKDGMDSSKPTGTEGKMVEYTTSYQAIALTSAIKVAATTAGHLTGSEITLTGSDQTIAHGDGAAGGAGTFSNAPLTFKQTVDYADPRLTTGFYQIIVTFTGTTP